MSCFYFYLLEVKNISSHAHRTGVWYIYLLGVLFKISDELPRPVLTGPPGPARTLRLNKLFDFVIVDCTGGQTFSWLKILLKLLFFVYFCSFFCIIF